ncbi:hypothetical protein K2Z83_19645 [Oscillochloris sp. ZM17-4]|uniref:hypothetical protein n=1 Tax=Oscillochloris sp. ZM17-4 TaxID=2866714 RepID=UPI001C732B9A|nr:hypothetical protein [Oscillochloris sp. ZM17-4]MBX0329882.1 hypothetical protein [Oscillochloris sp. ZM17-4]
MKHQTTLCWLIPPIFVLALVAAGLGLFDPNPGVPFAHTNHRGENVMINGQGLYVYDTRSSAAQMQGNDLITLVVGLPLLVISTLWAFRGSLRGRLLLTGTLGFFLYTYMSMSTLASYNDVFLVYVALFTLSLYTFILSMMSFDLATLPGHFSEKLPRGWIAGLMFIVAAFLGLAWLGRILIPLFQNQTPALENTTTLVIQFMDLALIAPAALLGGILLLRKSAWGYLLASVMLTKGVTMGLGVSAMGINMAFRGVPDSLGILIPFLLITAANLVMTIILLRNVNE